MFVEVKGSLCSCTVAPVVSFFLFDETEKLVAHVWILPGHLELKGSICSSRECTCAFSAKAIKVADDMYFLGVAVIPMSLQVYSELEFYRLLRNEWE